MPILQLFTNLHRKDFPANFDQDLANLFQKLIDKPMKYIIVNIIDGQALTYGGTQEPAAYMYVQSIGHISKELNAKYVKEIQEFVNKKLGIEMDRQTMCFTDLPGHMVGRNGALF